MPALSQKELFEKINSQDANNKISEIIIQDIICNEGIHFYSFDKFKKPIIIKNSCFKSRLDISSVHFKAPVLIQNCIIEEFHIGACGFHSTFDLLHTKILGLFEIWDSSFYGMTKFHKNDFLGGTNIFSKHESYGAVEFKGGLYFY